MDTGLRRYDKVVFRNSYKLIIAGSDEVGGKFLDDGVGGVRLAEIVVGAVDFYEGAGLPVGQKRLVGVVEFFQPVGQDVFFVVAAALGDAPEAVFDGVGEVDHQGWWDQVGLEFVGQVAVEFKLGWCEVELGEDAVLVEDIVADAGLVGLKVLAGELLDAAEQEEKLGSQGGVGLVGVLAGQEGVFVVLLQDELSIKVLGQVVGQGGFADADDTGDSDQGGSAHVFSSWSSSWRMVLLSWGCWMSGAISAKGCRTKDRLYSSG